MREGVSDPSDGKYENKFQGTSFREHPYSKSFRGERHVFMFDKKCVVMQELLKRIVIDPQVMAGKPVIRGTRITVDLVLELLAAGMSPEEISQDYRISIEDIRAVLLYAARGPHLDFPGLRSSGRSF
jgi:uncharacterized protein (DUF433 family)